MAKFPERPRMTGKAVGLICFALFSSLTATSMVKMNLSDLVKNSGRIVVGTCVESRELMMSLPGGGQLPYTSYSFAIHKTIKGAAGPMLEVRQFGHGSAGRGPRVVGMPSYVEGREYILLLTAESELGLTVPVGLSQGCFRVLPGSAGSKKKVANGLNNAGLFINPDGSKANFTASLNGRRQRQISRSPGALDYEQFMVILEMLVRQ